MTGAIFKTEQQKQDMEAATKLIMEQVSAYMKSTGKNAANVAKDIGCSPSVLNRQFASPKPGSLSPETARRLVVLTGASESLLDAFPKDFICRLTGFTHGKRTKKPRDPKVRADVDARHPKQPPKAKTTKVAKPVLPVEPQVPANREAAYAILDQVGKVDSVETAKALVDVARKLLERK